MTLRKGIALALVIAAIIGSSLAACATHVETAASGASGVGGGAATGSGSSQTVDAGPACQGPSDCDIASYCHADDEDCGPERCRKRPSGNGDVSADFVCGCNGVVYATAGKARGRLASTSEITLGARWTSPTSSRAVRGRCAEVRGSVAVATGRRAPTIHGTIA